jgi:hypothetical protein
MFAPHVIAYPSLGKTSEAVSGVVPYFCDTSLNSHLSWPPPILVLLLSAGVPCCAIVDTAPLIARPPAAVPGAGSAACRAPAPGLPTAAPMPRGPPPPAPAPSPGVGMLNGNRMCGDSFASVGPSAPPGPGFYVCWPSSGPRVSARTFPVSADWRGPPAAARVPPVTINLTFISRFVSSPSRWRNSDTFRAVRRQGHRRSQPRVHEDVAQIHDRWLGAEIN